MPFRFLNAANNLTYDSFSEKLDVFVQLCFALNDY